MQRRRWITSRRQSFGAFVAVLLLVTGFGVYRLANQSASVPSLKVTQIQSPESEQTYAIRLAAAGDMLSHDTVNKHALRADGSYDYAQFFKHVEPFFKKADIRFCNHEVPAAGEQLGISGYPVFNAPADFPEDLAAVGCNVFNVANNHINDKRQVGINATLDSLQTLDGILAVAGANRSQGEQHAVRYFTVKDTRFAFLAFSEISNDNNLSPYGLNMFDETLMARLVPEARKNADVVIVSMHWGTEYSQEINPVQRKWAAILAGHGTDIVIGTGPHVLQPVEKLTRADGKETLVWYSLGNMLSTQETLDTLTGGFAVVDIVAKNGLIIFDTPMFYPTYMHFEWTPEDRRSGNLLARHDLTIYSLNRAGVPLARTHSPQTADAQMEKVRSILNRYTSVRILSE